MAQSVLPRTRSLICIFCTGDLILGEYPGDPMEECVTVSPGAGGSVHITMHCTRCGELHSARMDHSAGRIEFSLFPGIV